VAAIAFSVKPLPFDPTKQRRTEFVALGKAEGGCCGWVLLTWVPRDKRPPTLGLPTTRRPRPAASRSSRSTCTRSRLPGLQRQRPATSRGLYAGDTLANADSLYAAD